MIGNMADGAAAAMAAITLNVAFKTPCSYNDLMQAKNLCADVAKTDSVMMDIRTILLTAQVLLRNTGNDDKDAQTAILETALTSIYNLLLTPEGEPK